MNTNGHIDIEKLTDSLETLESVENLVNYRDLSTNFEDLEEYFKKMNFEHSYCLYYKDYTNRIYDNLEYIKRKINELTDAIRSAKTNYLSIDSNSHKEISGIQEQSAQPSNTSIQDLTSTTSKLTTDLKSAMQTLTEDNISVIPKVETKEEQPQIINTIPIGIAIGATGIAGSAGAVVINELYGDKDSDNELEDYVEDIEIEEQAPSTLVKDNESSLPEQKLEEEIEPYQAIRHDREVDKFYGSEYQDIVLEDDEPETEKFDDDFYE